MGMSSILFADHPDAEMLTGWGARDTATGYSPDDAADWYWTRADAQAFIDTKKGPRSARSRRWMWLT